MDGTSREEYSRFFRPVHSNLREDYKEALKQLHEEILFEGCSGLLVLIKVNYPRLVLLTFVRACIAAFCSPSFVYVLPPFCLMICLFCYTVIEHCHREDTLSVVGMQQY